MLKANLNNDKIFLELVRLGRIKCFKNGKILNVKTGNEYKKIGNTGYYVVIAQDPYIRKTRQILAHRLIWNVFKGRIKDRTKAINHIDGNKLNNRISNLELVSHEENVRHSIDILHKEVGNFEKAEDRINSKFTNEQVLRYRKKFALGNYCHKKVASILKIHPLTLFKMLRGDTYSTVKSKYTKMCKEKLPKVGKGYLLSDYV